MSTSAVTGTKKTVLLEPRELADIYALKYLWDYLVEQVNKENLDATLLFKDPLNTERSREVLASIPSPEESNLSSIDVVVGCQSDIGGNGNLSIDIAVLKNCAVPMTGDEKLKLKQKYGVPLDEPILVVGYAHNSPDILKIAEAASEHAIVYLVGDSTITRLQLSERARGRVHFITQRGVLKDYYAMADATINAHNISYSDCKLHNFVEATEGGPLFMVPSADTAQYGYKQMVEAGAIVECFNVDDIIRRVTSLLNDFTGNDEALEARTRHIQRTRDQYLPVVLAHIKQMIGADAEIPTSDLVTYVFFQKKKKLMHPDSDWGCPYYNLNPLRTILPTIENTNPDKYLIPPRQISNPIDKPPTYYLVGGQIYEVGCLEKPSTTPQQTEPLSLLALYYLGMAHPITQRKSSDPYYLSQYLEFEERLSSLFTLKRGYELQLTPKHNLKGTCLLSQKIRPYIPSENFFEKIKLYLGD